MAEATGVSHHEVVGPGPDRALASILLLALVFYVAFMVRSQQSVDGVRHQLLFDDANISMRYGRNLLHGDGLVWNPGGDRIEAITNPGWTLVLALLHLVPLPARLMGWPVMAVGAGILLATAHRSWWVAQRLWHDRAASLAAAAVTAFGFPLVFWTLRGMEVGLLALLLLVAVDRLLDPQLLRHVATGVVLAAAVLCRLDALVPVAILLGWSLIHVGRTRRQVLELWVPVVVAIVGSELARKAYYGEWLPNTYYLKSTGMPRWNRIENGARVLGYTVRAGFAVMLAAAAVAAIGARNRATLLVASLAVVQVGYSVAVGGDAWEGLLFANRYIATAWPLFAALAVGVITPPLRRWAMLVGGAAVAVLMGGRKLEGDIVFEPPASYHLVSLGRYPFVIAVVALAAGIVAGVAVTRRRWRWSQAGVGSTAMVILLVLGSAGVGWGRWWHDGRFRAERATPVAGWLASHTDPSARIAVGTAGTIPYLVGDRDYCDLLGKADRHIARMPSLFPDGPFQPGHDKTDLRYSLATCQPDVVEGGFNVPASLMESHGFVQLSNGWWIREDSDLVEPPPGG